VAAAGPGPTSRADDESEDGLEPLKPNTNRRVIEYEVSDDDNSDEDV
jgi:hypothetical protein